MTDLFLFIRNGWVNIWKDKTIWLFSVLPLFNPTLNSFHITREVNLLEAVLSLASVLISFVLLLNGICLVIYRPFSMSVFASAYLKYSKGKTVAQ